MPLEQLSTQGPSNNGGGHLVSQRYFYDSGTYLVPRSLSPCCNFSPVSVFVVLSRAGPAASKGGGVRKGSGCDTGVEDKGVEKANEGQEGNAHTRARAVPAPRHHKGGLVAVPHHVWLVEAGEVRPGVGGKEDRRRRCLDELCIHQMIWG